jgi:hypothetical protein
MTWSHTAGGGMDPDVLDFDTKLGWQEKDDRNSLTCRTRSGRLKNKVQKADALVFDMSRRDLGGGGGGRRGVVMQKKTMWTQISIFGPLSYTQKDKSVCLWVLKLNGNITHRKYKRCWRGTNHSFQNAFSAFYLWLNILKRGQKSTFDDNNQH